MTTRTYTVTVSGWEREDGHKPFDYVVDADCHAEAVRQAVAFHLSDDPEQEQVLWVESCRPGVIANGYFNDLRGGNANV